MSRATCANCGIPIVPTDDGYTHMPESFRLDCEGPSPAQAGDLVGFLRARLVEQLRNGNWLGADLNGTPARRQTGYDLISDALAKLQRLDTYVEAREAVKNTTDLGDWSRAPVERAHAVARRDALRESVELDASSYASHPEYDQSWRP